MRHLRLVLVIVGLVVFFTLLMAYLTSRSPTYDLTADHASFRTNEWGTKALRELCKRNELTVQTYRRPWDEFAAPERAVMCVFDPNFGPQKQGIKALVEWVRGGGHLLLAVNTASALGFNPMYEHLDANHVMLGYLGLLTKPLGKYGETVAVRSVVPSPVAHQVTRLLVKSPARLVAAQSPEDIQQHWGNRVGDDQKLPKITPLAFDERVALLADEAGVLVMRLKLGTGLIDVISDADILGNGQIGEADNAVLAMNLIYTRGTPTTVYFDEYHHGRRTRPFADERLPGAAIFPAIWAALICLFLYLTGSFWRFGRPVPLTPEPRRSLAEHIQAFAGLYDGAQATGAAITMIAQRFHSRLAQLTGLGPAASAQDLATAAARTADIDILALTRLLTELQAIDADTRLSQSEMLHLAQRIAYFEEALTDGKPSDSPL